MLAFSVLLALSPAGGETPADIPPWVFYYIIYPLAFVVIVFFSWLKRRKKITKLTHCPFPFRLASPARLWDYPIMKLVADSRGRLTAADLFRPNTAFDASPQPDGSIRIVELVEKKATRARIVRRGGRMYLTNGRKITLADCQRVQEDFP